MYCRYCGEKNPDEAVFCRNCGKRLKEEVKKPEVVIEKPKTEQNTYQQSATTTSSSTNNNSDWISCCLCLIAIFIIFAIIGSF